MKEIKKRIGEKRKIIGKLIRSNRRAKDITQKELSNHFETSQPIFSQKIEAGTRRLDVAELWEICQFLEISFTELTRQIDELLKNDKDKSMEL